jgi:hypothetical protein
MVSLARSEPLENRVRGNLESWPTIFDANKLKNQHFIALIPSLIAEAKEAI